MSDDPITTPRRQRFLFGLPYGLSSATILAGLSTTPTGRTETAPQLPAPPEKPVEAPPGPIGPDVIASFERPTSSCEQAPPVPVLAPPKPITSWNPGLYTTTRRLHQELNHCTCGRWISANKTHCARCQK